jgi:hypothetical protein
MFELLKTLQKFAYFLCAILAGFMNLHFLFERFKTSPHSTYSILIEDEPCWCPLLFWRRRPFRWILLRRRPFRLLSWRRRRRAFRLIL